MASLKSSGAPFDPTQSLDFKPVPKSYSGPCLSPPSLKGLHDTPSKVLHMGKFNKWMYSFLQNVFIGLLRDGREGSPRT